MSNSKTVNTVHFEGDMIMNTVPEKVSCPNDSTSVSSITAGTDSELSKNSSITNLNVFTFPLLEFKGSDEGLEAVKTTKDYSFYVPADFTNELNVIITCYFFVFRVHDGTWLGPGTKFSRYRHPNQTGILFFRICNVLLLLTVLRCHVLGTLSGIYTIIGFYLDQTDQITVIFTQDDLETLNAQSDFFVDFLSNIVNKKGDDNTKILNKIIETIDDEDTIDCTVNSLCEFLTQKMTAGEIW